ncbi:ABC transporter substrate-binding protein [Belnapia rosea]|uniref:ABC transporter substrate-binding protein n=1 Tax=Belnapia rosea TaxID=938405 RepID=UPI00087E027D|nr:ABC transporter substrate-binding protein [Belnapia rosea]SDB74074.1 peptide/nickel transport system substrate-binding protein [Belnapia rosea]
MLTGRRGILGVGLAAASRPAQGIAQAPRRGGTLQMTLVPEPPILQLGVNNQGPTQVAASKIFQGLLRYNQKLEPLPELAKSWAVSSDGREYLFHLQEGVKFHDGRPMTADDVLFSLMKFHMELSPRVRAVFQQIEEATAPDPLTVRLVLKSPFEPFMLMFAATAACIVPKHLFDGLDYRQAPAVQQPIGTGPFRLAEWQKANFIRLNRFEGYWRLNLPYLDSIVFRIIPDSQSRALALQNGQVQLALANDIEPFDMPRFRAQPNIMVRTDGWEYSQPISWMEINHRVKPLDDARVRRAMSLAIDRDFVVNRLWFGLGKPCTGAIASTTRFYDPNVRLPRHDPRAAQQLLDASGYRADSRGIRFTLKHLVLPYGEVWTRLSEYLRQAMGRIGIELQLETTDAGSWAGRIGRWEYETSVNWVSQFGDPTIGVERTYVSSNIQKVTFTNTGGYSNPKVDALFQRAREGADAAARRETFRELQQLLIEEVPQIWIHELAFPTIADKRLQNLVTTGLSAHVSYDEVHFAG